MPTNEDDRIREPESFEGPESEADEGRASLGAAALRIAHEVNNQLGGILITAQYAGGGLARPDSRQVVQKALGDIEADVQRCSAALDELLRLAHAEGSSLTPSDLVELARIVVAEHGGAVHVASSPRGGTIVTLELPGSPRIE